MRKILYIIIASICSALSVYAQPAAEVRVYRDSTIVRNFKGGGIRDNMLHLYAKIPYEDLTPEDKMIVLDIFTPEYSDKGIIVHTADCVEYWIREVKGKLNLIDIWDINNPNLEELLPVAVEKRGPSRLFWQAGGMINGASDYFSAALNFRAGSYLYKNIVDCSVLANLGLSTASQNTDFNGDIGVMGRVYLPLKIKETPVSPYAGLGCTLSYAPSFYLELVLYTGVSVFLGPGSLDFGVQYGLTSKFACTFGYTFRPDFSNLFKK